MTPGWENVRLGLANSCQPRPRFELARSWKIVPILAVSFGMWWLLFSFVFR